MGRVKFDVDRIKSEMLKMKREYFELREASEKEVMDERNFAQEMMNLNGNDAKFGGQFQNNFGGMEVNSMKKWLLDLKMMIFWKDVFIMLLQ